MRKWILSSVVLLFSLTISATAAERNIVFIITDDESPTLGCYGDKTAVTPHIDALSADGMRFLNAYATTASCSASRSVVMSGLHNHKNGQYGHQHDFHKFSAYWNVVSLALPRVLSNAGYRTAQAGKYHVGPEEVFHFDQYIRGNDRNAVALAEACRDFLTKTSDERPFFLYFGTSDPHRGGGKDKTSQLAEQPDLFGNKPKKGSFPGIQEVFFDPAKVTVPSFLPDSPESRAELAQYYQSCARLDQGVGRIVEILKAAGVYDKTLIVFTSDHGMAFPGAKTNVYEPALKVPFIVRNPYEPRRGLTSKALLSHTDITPSLLDFAGGLDVEQNSPKKWVDPDAYWKARGENLSENRSGPNKFKTYHGKSWMKLLGAPEASHHKTLFASHTFHEIQMYYPMRVVRDERYKLIWNIAHPLPFPFASDLWAASTWQAQFKQGLSASYGRRTVGQYIQRPQFELFDLQQDPDETTNLALNPAHRELLERYKATLKGLQKELEDPWIQKWDYE